MIAVTAFLVEKRNEYLSGNVREKLALAIRSAELYPDDYTANVEALKAVQPIDLTASEISVRLGATWLPTEDVEDSNCRRIKGR